MNNQVQCPCRVDISGGTLDLWPIYCLINKKCYTITTAIDIFTTTTYTRSDDLIKLDIKDLEFVSKFNSLQDLFQSQDDRLKLFVKLFEYFRPNDFFTLTTSSQSPVGGGLGASSSLLISAIECMERVTDTNLGVLQKVTLAKNIESYVLGKPAGTQDYFAPILKSGITAINYSVGGITYETFDPISEFKENFMLVYTGKPHNSGINNWAVFSDAVSGNKNTLKTLEELADISHEVYNLFKTKNLTTLSEMLKLEFDARVRLSKTFTSEAIFQIANIVGEFKDSAVKICGAGGGGCVMIYSKHNEEIKRLLNFKVLNAIPI